MLPNESACERNRRLFQCEQPVAAITGSGAPRVGRYVAELFLSEGFRIVVHANHSVEAAQQFVQSANERSTQREDHQADLQAALIAGEVQDEKQVAGWVDQVNQTFGRIDVLVNSAAIWQPKSLEITSAADYEEAFRVNSLGTALCAQHFGLAMAAQPSGGAIVNIGDWAVQRPYRDFAAYFLSKACIETLTRSLAVELASRNPCVRVNAIFPGPIQLADGTSDEKRSRIVNDCLLRREGTADDLARAALFLATSPFVTGVSLPVDGGRSIFSPNSADAIAHPDVQMPEKY